MRSIQDACVRFTSYVSYDNKYKGSAGTKMAVIHILCIYGPWNS